MYTAGLRSCYVYSQYLVKERGSSMLSELVFLLFCKMNAVTLHCQFLISNVVLPSGVPHSNLFHFLAAKRATRKKNTAHTVRENNN